MRQHRRSWPGMAGLLLALCISGCADRGILGGQSTPITSAQSPTTAKQITLLAGQRDVSLSGQDSQLAGRGDARLFLSAEGMGEPLPLRGVSITSDGRWRGVLPEVPNQAADADVMVRLPGGAWESLHAPVRIVDQFRILLTFDDGPAIDGDPSDGMVQESPTHKVLEALDAFRHGPDRSRQGVTAVFFVLTQPDRFMLTSYPKGETEDGAVLLREVKERGHILAAHWGGPYHKQQNGHTKRVFDPPYSMGDVRAANCRNALESDLWQCMQRVQALTGERPVYVRPPCWKYRDPDDPRVEQEVLATYERLGLRMILSDAKYPDGGYAFYSRFRPVKMKAFHDYLRTAFLRGERDLVISMHDSNGVTANRLTEVLHEIEAAFANLSFGGQHADPGHYLKFIDSRQEALALLERKRRYAMFPEYVAAPPRTGTHPASTSASSLATGRFAEPANTHEERHPH